MKRMLSLFLGFLLILSTVGGSNFGTYRCQGSGEVFSREIVITESLQAAAVSSLSFARQAEVCRLDGGSY